MCRRTDFYCIATTPNSAVGLPQDWAENYVKQAFYKWKTKDVTFEEVPPQIVAHEEVVTTTSLESNSLKTENVNECEFSNSERYNGASYENYTWSQTIKEVDIIIKVPENVTSKDLKIDINSKHLSVKLKPNDMILLEGDLCNKCKHLDALWSLDKRKLEIHLEKATEIWWECLLTFEPKLDVTKIDCSRPFEELSEEAQAKIEELTWNQERKRLGLPTTQEILMQETLRKAWNAEGSPFSGPYNPDIVQFQT